MIVIDTSAIVAIALQETEQSVFGYAIASARERRLPVSCYLECVMVLSARRIRRDWIDRYVRDADISMSGSDALQGRLAADAFERFGRGSGHPAKLNFGDCLAYAAAAALNAPLLFKGEDFLQTDIRPAHAG